jgi:hypothetical protein
MRPEDAAAMYDDPEASGLRAKKPTQLSIEQVHVAEPNGSWTQLDVPPGLTSWTHGIGESGLVAQADSVADGPFYHGTVHPHAPGDEVDPNNSRNYFSDEFGGPEPWGTPVKRVFFTKDQSVAARYGEEPGGLFRVEPTGPYFEHPWEKGTLVSAHPLKIVEKMEPKLGKVAKAPVYKGFIYLIQNERDIDLGAREHANPDDPDGDMTEQSAWWDIDHAKKNPALRKECKKGTPWGELELWADKSIRTNKEIKQAFAKLAASQTPAQMDAQRWLNENPSEFTYWKDSPDSSTGRFNTETGADLTPDAEHEEQRRQTNALLDQHGFRYVEPPSSTQHGFYYRDSPSTPGMGQRLTEPTGWNPFWQVHQGPARSYGHSDYAVGMHQHLEDALLNADHQDSRLTREAAVSDPFEKARAGDESQLPTTEDRVRRGDPAAGENWWEYEQGMQHDAAERPPSRGAYSQIRDMISKGRPELGVRMGDEVPVEHHDAVVSSSHPAYHEDPDQSQPRVYALRNNQFHTILAPVTHAQTGEDGWLRGSTKTDPSRWRLYQEHQLGDAVAGRAPQSAAERYIRQRATGKPVPPEVSDPTWREGDVPLDEEGHQEVTPKRDTWNDLGILRGYAEEPRSQDPDKPWTDLSWDEEPAFVSKNPEDRLPWWSVR